ncbi:NucA/NucB deoxyribonuclease domain-containing protein [Actinokineospora sp. G85]|uniref:NucA/NucB deoxyribonuclease domain-containing protein n=1 Tax=Actinokineospora sp. G85 TaxID=3406626 RepID=UPI003C7129AA
MSTKTKSGLLPILLVAGVVVAVTQTEIAQEVGEALGIVDSAPGDMIVPPSDRGRVKECTPEQLTKDKRCKDLPVMVFDAARMPYISRHITMAWQAGHPALLHRGEVGSGGTNRSLACTELRKVELKPTSCDEYPFASTMEGGAAASTQGVPGREQKIQGGVVNGTYTKNKMQPGAEFLVVVINSGDIAQEPFKG